MLVSLTVAALALAAAVAPYDPTVASSLASVVAAVLLCITPRGR